MFQNLRRPQTPIPLKLENHLDLHAQTKHWNKPHWERLPRGAKACWLERFWGITPDIPSMEGEDCHFQAQGPQNGQQRIQVPKMEGFPCTLFNRLFIKGVAIFHLGRIHTICIHLRCLRIPPFGWYLYRRFLGEVLEGGHPAPTCVTPPGNSKELGLGSERIYRNLPRISNLEPARRSHSANGPWKKKFELCFPY